MPFLQSLFSGSGDVRGRYSKSLIQASIERAVDGTDSRIRLLSGYRKRLLEPVVTAIDHSVALVDDLPPPLPASREGYRDDPRLSAVFASPDLMLRDLSRDTALRDFLVGPGQYAEQVTALLMTRTVEKHILGRDLVDGQVRRDVPQVAVSFTGHRLVDPAAAELETRRQLKRRTFDQILTLALARITSTDEERTDLKRQRSLLKSKLAAFEREGLSFTPPENGFQDQRALQNELERINGQLHTLGADDHVLQTHLKLVAEVLADAGRQLWSRDISLHLDAMNIEREARDPQARRIILRELHKANGERSIMLLLTLSPRELPPREDLLTEAARYLY